MIRKYYKVLFVIWYDDHQRLGMLFVFFCHDRQIQGFLSTSIILLYIIIIMPKAKVCAKARLAISILGM